MHLLQLSKKIKQPLDHGSKIRIQFFSLRMERSSLFNPHFCVYWQPIVDQEMAKKPKKIIVKENSFDSGFSSDSG